MLNNPDNTEEMVNELNEVEMKIKNLKAMLKNKLGTGFVSKMFGFLLQSNLSLSDVLAI